MDNDFPLQDTSSVERGESFELGNHQSWRRADLRGNKSDAAVDAFQAFFSSFQTSFHGASRFDNGLETDDFRPESTELISSENKLSQNSFASYEETSALLSADALHRNQEGEVYDDTLSTEETSSAFAKEPHSSSLADDRTLLQESKELAYKQTNQGADKNSEDAADFIWTSQSTSSEDAHREKRDIVNKLDKVHVTSSSVENLQHSSYGEYAVFSIPSHSSSGCSDFVRFSTSGAVSENGDSVLENHPRRIASVERGESFEVAEKINMRLSQLSKTRAYESGSLVGFKVSLSDHLEDNTESDTFTDNYLDTWSSRDYKIDTAANSQSPETADLFPKGKESFEECFASNNAQSQEELSFSESFADNFQTDPYEQAMVPADAYENFSQICTDANDNYSDSVSLGISMSSTSSIERAESHEILTPRTACRQDKHGFILGAGGFHTSFHSSLYKEDDSTIEADYTITDEKYDGESYSFKPASSLNVIGPTATRSVKIDDKEDCSKTQNVISSTVVENLDDNNSDDVSAEDSDISVDENPSSPAHFYVEEVDDEAQNSDRRKIHVHVKSDSFEYVNVNALPSKPFTLSESNYISEDEVTVRGLLQTSNYSTNDQQISHLVKEERMNADSFTERGDQNRLNETSEPVDTMTVQAKSADELWPLDISVRYVSDGDLKPRSPTLSVERGESFEIITHNKLRQRSIYNMFGSVEQFQKAIYPASEVRKDDQWTDTGRNDLGAQEVGRKDAVITNVPETDAQTFDIVTELKEKTDSNLQISPANSEAKNVLKRSDSVPSFRGSQSHVLPTRRHSENAIKAAPAGKRVRHSSTEDRPSFERLSSVGRAYSELRTDMTLSLEKSRNPFLECDEDLPQASLQTKLGQPSEYATVPSRRTNPFLDDFSENSVDIQNSSRVISKSPQKCTNPFLDDSSVEMDEPPQAVDGPSREEMQEPSIKWEIRTDQNLDANDSFDRSKSPTSSELRRSLFKSSWQKYQQVSSASDEYSELTSATDINSQDVSTNAGENTAFISPGNPFTISNISDDFSPLPETYKSSCYISFGYPTDNSPDADKVLLTDSYDENKDENQAKSENSDFEADEAASENITETVCSGEGKIFQNDGISYTSSLNYSVSVTSDIYETFLSSATSAETPAQSLREELVTAAANKPTNPFLVAADSKDDAHPLSQRTNEYFDLGLNSENNWNVTEEDPFEIETESNISIEIEPRAPSAAKKRSVSLHLSFDDTNPHGKMNSRKWDRSYSSTDTDLQLSPEPSSDTPEEITSTCQLKDTYCFAEKLSSESESDEDANDTESSGCEDAEEVDENATEGEYILEQGAANDSATKVHSKIPSNSDKQWLLPGDRLRSSFQKLEADVSETNQSVSADVTQCLVVSSNSETTIPSSDYSAQTDPGNFLGLEQLLSNFDTSADKGWAVFEEQNPDVMRQDVIEDPVKDIVTENDWFSTAAGKSSSFQNVRSETNYVIQRPEGISSENKDFGNSSSERHTSDSQTNPDKEAYQIMQTLSQLTKLWDAGDAGDNSADLASDECIQPDSGDPFKMSYTSRIVTFSRENSLDRNRVSEDELDDNVHKEEKGDSYLQTNYVSSNNLSVASSIDHDLPSGNEGILGTLKDGQYDKDKDDGSLSACDKASKMETARDEKPAEEFLLPSDEQQNSSLPFTGNKEPHSTFAVDFNSTPAAEAESELNTSTLISQNSHLRSSTVNGSIMAVPNHPQQPSDQWSTQTGNNDLQPFFSETTSGNTENFSHVENVCGISEAKTVTVFTDYPQTKAEENLPDILFGLHESFVPNANVFDAGTAVHKTDIAVGESEAKNNLTGVLPTPPNSVSDAYTEFDRRITDFENENKGREEDVSTDAIVNISSEKYSSSSSSTASSDSISRPQSRNLEEDVEKSWTVDNYQRLQNDPEYDASTDMVFTHSSTVIEEGYGGFRAFNDTRARTRLHQRSDDVGGSQSQSDSEVEDDTGDRSHRRHGQNKLKPCTDLSLVTDTLIDYEAGDDEAYSEHVTPVVELKGIPGLQNFHDSELQVVCENLDRNKGNRIGYQDRYVNSLADRDLVSNVNSEMNTEGETASQQLASQSSNQKGESHSDKEKYIHDVAQDVVSVVIQSAIKIKQAKEYHTSDLDSPNQDIDEKPERHGYSHYLQSERYESSVSPLNTEAEILTIQTEASYPQSFMESYSSDEYFTSKQEGIEAVLEEKLYPDNINLPHPSADSQETSDQLFGECVGQLPTEFEDQFSDDSLDKDVTVVLNQLHQQSAKLSKKLSKVPYDIISNEAVEQVSREFFDLPSTESAGQFSNDFAELSSREYVYQSFSESVDQFTRDSEDQLTKETVTPSRDSANQSSEDLFDSDSLSRKSVDQISTDSFDVISKDLDKTFSKSVDSLVFHLMNQAELEIKLAEQHGYSFSGNEMDVWYTGLASSQTSVDGAILSRELSPDSVLNVSSSVVFPSAQTSVEEMSAKLQHSDSEFDVSSNVLSEGPSGDSQPSHFINNMTNNSPTATATENEDQSSLSEQMKQLSSRLDKAAEKEPGMEEGDMVFSEAKTVDLIHTETSRENLPQRQYEDNDFSCESNDNTDEDLLPRQPLQKVVALFSDPEAITPQQQQLQESALREECTLLTEEPGARFDHNSLERDLSETETDHFPAFTDTASENSQRFIVASDTSLPLLDTERVDSFTLESTEQSAALEAASLYSGDIATTRNSDLKELPEKQEQLDEEELRKEQIQAEQIEKAGEVVATKVYSEWEELMDERIQRKEDTITEDQIQADLKEVLETEMQPIGIFCTENQTNREEKAKPEKENMRAYLICPEDNYVSEDQAESEEDLERRLEKIHPEVELLTDFGKQEEEDIIANESVERQSTEEYLTLVSHAQQLEEINESLELPGQLFLEEVQTEENGAETEVHPEDKMEETEIEPKDQMAEESTQPIQVVFIIEKKFPVKLEAVGKRILQPSDECLVEKQTNSEKEDDIEEETKQNETGMHKASLESNSTDAQSQSDTESVDKQVQPREEEETPEDQTQQSNEDLKERRSLLESPSGPEEDDMEEKQTQSEVDRIERHLHPEKENAIKRGMLLERAGMEEYQVLSEEDTAEISRQPEVSDMIPKKVEPLNNEMSRSENEETIEKETSSEEDETECHMEREEKGLIEVKTPPEKNEAEKPPQARDIFENQTHSREKDLANIKTELERKEDEVGQPQPVEEDLKEKPSQPDKEDILERHSRPDEEDWTERHLRSEEEDIAERHSQSEEDIEERYSQSEEEDIAEKHSQSKEEDIAIAERHSQSEEGGIEERHSQSEEEDIAEKHSQSEEEDIAEEHSQSEEEDILERLSQPKDEDMVGRYLQPEEEDIAERHSQSEEDIEEGHSQSEEEDIAEKYSQSEEEDIAEKHSQSEEDIEERHSQSEVEDIAEKHSQSEEEDRAERCPQLEEEDILERHSKPKDEDMVGRYSQPKEEDIAEKYSQSEKEDIEERHSQSEDEDILKRHSQSEEEDIAEKYSQSEEEDIEERHSQSEEEDIEERHSQSEDEDILEKHSQLEEETRTEIHLQLREEGILDKYSQPTNEIMVETHSQSEEEDIAERHSQPEEEDSLERYSKSEEENREERHPQSEEEDIAEKHSQSKEDRTERCPQVDEEDILEIHSQPNDEDMVRRYSQSEEEKIAEKYLQSEEEDIEERHSQSEEEDIAEKYSQSEEEDIEERHSQSEDEDILEKHSQLEEETRTEIHLQLREEGILEKYSQPTDEVMVETHSQWEEEEDMAERNSQPEEKDILEKYSKSEEENREERHPQTEKEDVLERYLQPKDEDIAERHSQPDEEDILKGYSQLEEEKIAERNSQPAHDVITEGHAQVEEDILERHSESEDEDILERHSQSEEYIFENHSQPKEETVLERYSQAEDEDMRETQSQSQDEAITERYSESGEQDILERQPQPEEEIFAEKNSQPEVEDILERHLQSEDEDIEEKHILSAIVTNKMESQTRMEQENAIQFQNLPNKEDMTETQAKYEKEETEISLQIQTEDDKAKHEKDMTKIGANHEGVMVETGANYEEDLAEIEVKHDEDMAETEAKHEKNMADSPTQPEGGLPEILTEFKQTADDVYSQLQAEQDIMKSQTQPEEDLAEKLNNSEKEEVEMTSQIRRAKNILDWQTYSEEDLVESQAEAENGKDEIRCQTQLEEDVMGRHAQPEEEDRTKNESDIVKELEIQLTEREEDILGKYAQSEEENKTEKQSYSQEESVLDDQAHADFRYGDLELSASQITIASNYFNYNNNQRGFHDHPAHGTIENGNSENWINSQNAVVRTTDGDKEEQLDQKESEASLEMQESNTTRAYMDAYSTALADGLTLDETGQHLQTSQYSLSSLSPPSSEDVRKAPEFTSECGVTYVEGLTEMEVAICGIGSTSEDIENLLQAEDAKLTRGYSSPYYESECKYVADHDNEHENKGVDIVSDATSDNSEGMEQSAQHGFSKLDGYSELVWQERDDTAADFSEFSILKEELAENELTQSNAFTSSSSDDPAIQAHLDTEPVCDIDTIKDRHLDCEVSHEGEDQVADDTNNYGDHLLLDQENCFSDNSTLRADIYICDSHDLKSASTDSESDLKSQRYSEDRIQMDSEDLAGSHIYSSELEQRLHASPANTFSLSNAYHLSDAKQDVETMVCSEVFETKITQKSNLDPFREETSGQDAHLPETLGVIHQQDDHVQNVFISTKKMLSGDDLLSAHSVSNEGFSQNCMKREVTAAKDEDSEDENSEVNNDVEGVDNECNSFKQGNEQTEALRILTTTSQSDLDSSYLDANHMEHFYSDSVSINRSLQYNDSVHALGKLQASHVTLDTGSSEFTEPSVGDRTEMTVRAIDDVLADSLREKYQEYASFSQQSTEVQQITCKDEERSLHLDLDHDKITESEQAEQAGIGASLLEQAISTVTRSSCDDGQLSFIIEVPSAVQITTHQYSPEEQINLGEESHLPQGDNFDENFIFRDQHYGSSEQQTRTLNAETESNSLSSSPYSSTSRRENGFNEEATMYLQEASETSTKESILRNQQYESSEHKTTTLKAEEKSTAESSDSYSSKSWRENGFNHEATAYLQEASQTFSSEDELCDQQYGSNQQKTTTLRAEAGSTAKSSSSFNDESTAYLQEASQTFTIEDEHYGSNEQKTATLKAEAELTAESSGSYSTKSWQEMEFNDEATVYLQEASKSSTNESECCDEPYGSSERKTTTLKAETESTIQSSGSYSSKFWPEKVFSEDATAYLQEASKSFTSERELRDQQYGSSEQKTITLNAEVESTAQSGGLISLKSLRENGFNEEATAYLQEASQTFTSEGELCDQQYGSSEQMTTTLKAESESEAGSSGSYSSKSWRETGLHEEATAYFQEASKSFTINGELREQQYESSEQKATTLKVEAGSTAESSGSYSSKSLRENGFNEEASAYLQETSQTFTSEDGLRFLESEDSIINSTPTITSEVMQREFVIDSAIHDSLHIPTKNIYCSSESGQTFLSGALEATLQAPSFDVSSDFFGGVGLASTYALTLPPPSSTDSSGGCSAEDSRQTVRDQQEMLLQVPPESSLQTRLDFSNSVVPPKPPRQFSDNGEQDNKPLINDDHPADESSDETQADQENIDPSKMPLSGLFKSSKAKKSKNKNKGKDNKDSQDTENVNEQDQRETTNQTSMTPAASDATLTPTDDIVELGAEMIGFSQQIQDVAEDEAKEAGVVGLEENTENSTDNKTDLTTEEDTPAVLQTSENHIFTPLDTEDPQVSPSMKEELVVDTQPVKTDGSLPSETGREKQSLLHDHNPEGIICCAIL